ncbi:glycosyltransferase family 4 protein, partial [Myxococcota bacterium]|nr:glycosyltransferase family 4 protein [Myxococcota bacterium]
RVVRTIHAERSLNPRLGQRWLNKRANGWIVRSETHQSLLLNRFKPDPSAIRVISGSLDAESFQNIDIEMRKNARKRFQLPEDARVLAHVALIAGRGQEELVEAIAAMGDAAPHLLFVGRGENEDSLRALVHERGVENKVRFSGYLQGDDLLNAYAAADTAFVAQPGNDASARAKLEAMAAALPVLAVRTGSLVETVSHTRGYFIEEKTPKSIQSTIEKWLGDPEARQKGQIGREWVLSERSFVKEAEQVLSFYEYLYQNIPC